MPPVHPAPSGPSGPPLPAATTVVVIGAGVVGLMTALCLRERGVPVVVLEKGVIAGEQSSRNLGWIRQMGRKPEDLPLAMAAARLWPEMAQRVGGDVGHRVRGIMYVARTEAEMARHEAWLDAVKGSGVDSQLVDAATIARLMPGGTGTWRGGIYTASDSSAEPALAPDLMAAALRAKGGMIVEHCAVRALVRHGGAVRGVATEHGEIACDQVVVAAGIWARRFLGNAGVELLALPVIASALRTAPVTGPGEIAVGGPDFSFRRNHQGGYTITQRGRFEVPIIPDSLRIGRHFADTLRQEWAHMRLVAGRDFLREARTPRRWAADAASPFEQVRTMDPPVCAALNHEAMRNLGRAWPQLGAAPIAHQWAGMIDVTPDSLPVISCVPGVPGLILATGFSGHGFGTAPAAGQLACDLVLGNRPLVDPAPYRLARQGVAAQGRRP